MTQSGHRNSPIIVRWIGRAIWRHLLVCGASGVVRQEKTANAKSAGLCFSITKSPVLLYAMATREPCCLNSSGNSGGGCGSSSVGGHVGSFGGSVGERGDDSMQPAVSPVREQFGLLRFHRLVSQTHLKPRQVQCRQR